MKKLGKNSLMQIDRVSDFCKVIVKDYGYTYDRKKGSHMIYVSSNLPTLSIPDSGILSDGTKRNLVKLILGDSYYTK